MMRGAHAAHSPAASPSPVALAAAELSSSSSNQQQQQQQPCSVLFCPLLSDAHLDHEVLDDPVEL
jgi:hypothetical protein